MNATFKQVKIVIILLILLITITGCTTQKPVPPNEDQSLSTSPQPAAPVNEAVNEPSVEYEPAWPDQTVSSSSGHLVNSCMNMFLER